MATAVRTNTIVYTLQLSQAEANFIAAVFQNSFYQKPEEEPANELKMRESIFEAIKNAA